MSTPIEPKDILKGDLIRKEYSPKLRSVTAREYIAQFDGDERPSPGARFLLDRPKPPVVVPTERGYYLDSTGDVWTLSGYGQESLDPQYAPFTRLEPVPETAKKVLDAMEDAFLGLSSFPSVTAAFTELRTQFGVTE